jgi:eukaryotic-like serine/threonine-protein kinase
MANEPTNPLPSQLLAEVFATDALNSNTRAQSALQRGLQLDLSDPNARKLGRYQLLSKLGEGGMGVVFRAHEPQLQRDVALKILAAGMWATPEYVQKFRAEAQSAAKLFHPNIVPIFDIDQADDLVFFTMALVDGETLSQRLKRQGAMTEAEAASLLLAIASATHYAHQLGVLHLDLKPSNVLIDQKGTAFIADFGLARQLEQVTDSPQVNDGATGSLTSIVGTPGFMAPEQIQSEFGVIDQRTDVFGLGGVLYATLTGLAPYSGPSAEAAVRATLSEPIKSLASVRSGVSPDLAAIAEKALQRDPQRRYESAAAMADDLRSFLEQRPIQALQRNPWRRFLLWTRREPSLALSLIGLLLVLSIGLASSLYQARLATRAAVNAQTQASNARRVSSFLTNMLSAADPAQHRGKPPTAVELLDRARLRIDRNEFADQPLLNAELHLVMAKSYRGQSRIDDCLPLAERAVELATKASNVDPTAFATQQLLMQSRLAQADCMIQKSQLKEAIVVLQANQQQAKSDPALALEAIDSTVIIARALRLSDDRPEARRQLEALLKQAPPQRLELQASWARAQLTLGRILDEDGDIDRAIALMQSGLQALTRADGADAPGVLSAQIELGQMQIIKVCTPAKCDVAATADGFTRINSALADLRRVLGSEHIAVAFALTNRADMRQLIRDDVAALADYQQAFAIANRISGNSRYALNYQLSMAETLVRLSRFAEAETTFAAIEQRLPSTEGMNPHALKSYQRDLASGRCAILQQQPERSRSFRTPGNIEGCGAP